MPFPRPAERLGRPLPPFLEIPMVNHTFLATQLRTAQAAISRALQAVEADQVGADPPHVPTREDLRAALAADGLAELHGTHRPGDHADAAPPRSCQSSSE